MRKKVLLILNLQFLHQYIYIYIFFNKCVLFLRHNFQITEHIFRIFVFVILFIGPV